MLPFEVSPGDDKSFDNPPIVLRQVPESPMLLSITSGTSEGIEAGTLALRFASSALDQGCVDVACTGRLGENRSFPGRGNSMLPSLSVTHRALKSENSSLT